MKPFLKLFQTLATLWTGWTWSVSLLQRCTGSSPHAGENPRKEKWTFQIQCFFHNHPTKSLPPWVGRPHHSHWAQGNVLFVRGNLPRGSQDPPTGTWLILCKELLRDLQDLLASEIHLFHLCWHPRSQNLHLCFTFSIKAAAKLLVLSSSCRLEKDHCIYMVGMLTRSDERLLKVSLISSLNQAWLGYLHVGQWSTLALQSWQRMWPV